MTKKSTDIIEYTEQLGTDEWRSLVNESSYIIGFTVTSEMEPDDLGFEGGDTWIFDQYGIQIDHQFTPNPTEAEWTNRVLSMPGYKEGQDSSHDVHVGGRYIAFYHYSSMARSYSLEGLVKWTDQKSEAIEQQLGEQ